MPGAQGERDWIVSRMHTCQLGGMSPFDHLTALQMNGPAAVPSPAKWLPWNFPKAAATANQTRRSRHGVKSTAAPAPRTLADPTRRLPGRRGFVDAAKLALLDSLPVPVEPVGGLFAERGGGDRQQLVRRWPAPTGAWPQELVAPWEFGSRAESGGHRVDH